MTGNELMRMRTLQAVVLLIFGVIVLRLAYLQLFNPRYIELARANVLRHEVLYPPRGEVLDRNGEYLVQSRACYDLMVTYRDIDREGFDTVQLCAVTGLSREKLERELRNARMRPRAPRLLMSYLPEGRTSCVSTSAISAVSTRSTAPRVNIRARWGATCWVSWAR